jgi:hypothetical protein
MRGRHISGNRLQRRGVRGPLGVIDSFAFALALALALTDRASYEHTVADGHAGDGR